MCGVAGMLRLDGGKVEADVIRAMTRTLAHRGPDGEGVFIDGIIGLGHRRLAIRGLGEAGKQPLTDDTGQITVSYNGEVYNEQWLQQEIAKKVAVNFRTRCDTELIAPAYLAWGDTFVERLEGMFAIALWDKKAKKLLLARDPVGIKPLYLATTPGAIYFASEIKALLAAPQIGKDVCPQGLLRFLAQGYPGPERSTFKFIRPLPPGSALIFANDQVRQFQYWQPSRKPDILTMADAKREFELLWPAVISEMKVSDVPIGVLLSGGIDSALVSSELVKTGTLPAFTASFLNASHDESGRASSIARELGLPHHVLTVAVESNQEHSFRRMVHHHDGQLGDSSAFPFFSVCERAKENVPVLFSGDGADEFFAGYETYRASVIASWISPWLPPRLASHLSVWLRKVSAHSAEAVPTAEKLSRLLAGIAVGNGQCHPQWRRTLFADDAPSLYGDALAELINQDPLDEYVAAMEGAGSLLDQCLQADQRYYLPGDLLMKSDSMSMAHGIELRVPFLDRRIMDLAGRIHSSLLTPMEGPDKMLLRLLLEDRGFKRGVTRARKHGFNLPVSQILRCGLRELGDRLLDENADVLSPQLNPDRVRSMWRVHQEHQANNSYALWNMLCFAVMREQL